MWEVLPAAVKSSTHAPQPPARNRPTGRSSAFHWQASLSPGCNACRLTVPHCTAHESALQLDGRRISVTRAVPQSETAPGTPADALRRGQMVPRDAGRQSRCVPSLVAATCVRARWRRCAGAGRGGSSALARVDTQHGLLFGACQAAHWPLPLPPVGSPPAAAMVVVAAAATAAAMVAATAVRVSHRE